jgi:hypothetical protein
MFLSPAASAAGLMVVLLSLADAPQKAIADTLG